MTDWLWDPITTFCFGVILGCLLVFSAFGVIQWMDRRP